MTDKQKMFMGVLLLIWSSLSALIGAGVAGFSLSQALNYGCIWG